MEVRCHWKSRARSNPYPRTLKRLIARAAEAAGLPVGQDWRFELHFLDDGDMAAANAEYVGHSGTTDVITFSYLDDPASLFPGDVGLELLISAEVAGRVGDRRADSDYARELALYIVHGCLHASGEDDLEPAARRRMRRREHAVLAAIGVDPLRGGRGAAATQERSKRRSTAQ